MGFFMAACGTSYEEPETAIDAGRQFISAIYNGNFKRAGQLIVQDEANALYVYQYYVSGNKRLQSAWHKWTIGTSANTNILNADFIENSLYLVIQRGTDVFIETLDISPNLTDTGASYLTHLDRKIQENSTGVSRSYNAGTDQTTITLPYAIKNTMSVVTRSGGANISGREIAIVSQTVDGTTIVVSGNVSSTNLFIGETYNFTFTFSQQFMQDADTAGSKISVKEGNIISIINVFLKLLLL
jgi:hypothetical protein